MKFASLGGWITLGVIIVLVILIVIFVWKTYNNMVTERQKVKNGFSQIDVQLKKRFDLIPNLAETVKGYAKEETEIWEEFAKARSLYDRARAGETPDVQGMAQANASLGTTLGKLMIVQEQYPELKANENFKSLMATLASLEDKISYARQFYNDVVQKYNTYIEKFPAVLIAGLLHFKQAEYFEIKEEQREAPKVSF